MNNSKISVRYAKALFLAAVEEKVLDQVMKDANLLNESLQVEGFKQMLKSPVIKTSEKKKFFKEVFSKNVSGLMMNFLNLILTNNRENFLEAMLRNFTEQYYINKGVKRAELTVPKKVSEGDRQKFLNLLKKMFDANIELKDKVNPDIIGGFILKVDDEQFDASVSSSLLRMKKKLLETSIEK